MERASLLRLLLIAGAIFAFVWLVKPDWLGGGGPSQEQPFFGRTGYESMPAGERAPEAICKLSGDRFEAELSSRGASLEHLYLTEPKYSRAGDDSTPIDLVTTEAEYVAPLRTDLRLPCEYEEKEVGGEKKMVCVPAGEADQVAYNNVDWTLSTETEGRCVFTYEDDRVVLEKTIRTTERAFELAVGLEVTNRGDEANEHRLTVETTDWREQEEIEGTLGRVSEKMTQVEAHWADETERFTPDDFEPDAFEEEGFTAEGWRQMPGNPTWVAVSSSYFSKALFPREAPDPPKAELLVEHHWNRAEYESKEDDPKRSYVFRSRLAYPLKKLEPGASASYDVLAFVGPKERQVLASVGGAGAGLEATELLDLGWFGAIGTVLIRYLYLLYDLVGYWGWAICLLTITVKILLFPLSITQIKSSFAMRKLKPQLDEINKKYKEDAQQRAVAMQELMRKNNVTNPMLGCLPMLLQMPVWLALYQALQTAVELYHTSFGPFIPDLSAPGEYFIIPAALGASSFLQQHLMPMQGDPMQQKLMKYFMPAMFTAFMLFLPAGLGIYFLTNTWLGIVQQVSVERFYKAREAAAEPADESEEAEEDEEAAEEEPPKRKGGRKGGKSRSKTAVETV